MNKTYLIGITLVILLQTVNLSLNAQAFNPFTQNIEFSPEPPNTGFECDYHSQLIFAMGFTTMTDAHLDPNDPLKVYICLTGFEFDGTTPSSILSGSYISHFNWAFDPISPNCLVGTQNGPLPGTGTNPLNPNPNSVGSIIVDLVVNDISPAGSILVGDVTLEVPAYMDISNTIADDNELTQTQTSAVCPIDIYGNVFYDIDGDANNQVDGVGISSICSTPLYVHLVDPNFNVDDVQMVSADGSFHFNDAKLESAYAVILSSVQGTINGPVPSASLPCFWNFVGDDCCDNVGNDGAHNGIMTVNIDTNQTYQANFGVSAPVLSLPVELSSFTLIENQCKMKLDWTTSFQYNLEKTIVERRFEDENEFRAIHEIMAKSSESVSSKFSFTDIDNKNLDKQAEYRLKFVDRDQSHFISQVKSAKIRCAKSNATAHIYPNPSNGSLNIVHEALNDLIQIIILDVQGRELFRIKEVQDSRVTSLDLSELIPAHYMMVFKNLDTGTMWTEPFQVF